MLENFEARSAYSKFRQQHPRIITDITRKRLSLATSGNKNGMFGKKQSEETKQKIRNSLKASGYYPSVEARLKISKTHKGKPKSKAQRTKMSMAASNRIYN